ncbi:MAG TPA: CocE/NonD family hydrolase [Burkholderiales bacterium]
MSLRLTLLVAAVCWCAGLLLVEGPAPGRFVQQDIFIPAHGGHTTLAITILRPRGAGPFSAVILNHGVPFEARERTLESSELLLHAAAEFARRGYAVFMPLRRGFGASGGAFAENPGTCDDANYRRAERAAAADVLAAYQFVRRLPYVDASHVILAGQSAGGVAALYSAAQSPPGLRAVLAFAAGRGADATLRGVPCAAERLAEVFDDVGRTLRVPALLYYTRNDLFFGPAATRTWFERLKAGGAPAEYVLQPAFGANGHFVFTHRAGIEHWLPVVERFLERHGIAFPPPAPPSPSARA